MRRSLLLLLVLALAASGYVYLQKTRAEAGSQLAAGIEPGEPLPDLMGELRKQRGQFRLAPDARCLSAAAILDGWLRDGKETVPVAAFDDASLRWNLSQGGKSIGTLPELPAYEDCQRLLDAMVAKANIAPDSNGLALTPQSAAFAFDDPLPLLNNLRALEGNGPVKAWEARKLMQLARGLAYLQMQGIDELGLNDRLAATAWAADTLATARSGVVDTENRTLLAHNLGYGRAARHYATLLPAENPVRLYAERNAQLLLRVAQPVVQQNALIRYLYLALLADQGDYTRWLQWLEQYPRTHWLEPAVWGTALRINAFVAAGAADSMAYFTAGRMQALAQQQDGATMAQKLRGAMDALSVLPEQKAGDKNTPPPPLAEFFEGGLTAVAGTFDGRVINKELAASLYRGVFYSSVLEAGLFQLHTRGDPRGAFAWLTNFSGSIHPYAKAYHDWFAALIAAEDGSKHPAKIAALAATMSNDSLVGAPVRIRTLAVLQEDLLQGTDPVWRTHLHGLTARLDSRPSSAAKAGIALFTIQNEFRYSEQLLNHVDTQATGNDVNWRSWRAMLTQDRDTLRGIALDVAQPAVDRWAAAERFEYVVGKGQAEAHALYREICRRREADWSFSKDCVTWLTDQGDYPAAVSTAKSWLALKLPDPGLQRVHMLAKQARALRKAGDFQGAWRVVKPAMDSGAGAPMSEGARALAGLKRVEEADAIWQSLLARYSTHLGTRTDYLLYLWAQNRDQEAADFLESWGASLNDTDWRQDIARVFHLAKKQQPDASIVAAVSLLAQKKLAPDMLRHIAYPYEKENRTELALKIRMELPASAGLQQLQVMAENYALIKKVEGLDYAVSWFRQSMPAVPGISIALFYRIKEPEALWMFDFKPDAPGFEDILWLFRAGSALRDGTTSERQQQLADHYRGTSQSNLHRLGRYLLGFDNQEKLLSGPIPGKERYVHAYAMGLKAQCEGRISDAADWYQVVQATTTPRKIEYHYAAEQLAEWAAQVRLPSKIDGGCAMTGLKPEQLGPPAAPPG